MVRQVVTGGSLTQLRSVYTERDRGLVVFAKEWSK